jgi:hypothetical protein
MQTTLSLNWPANPVSELVTSYRVFCSLNGGSLDFIGTTDTNSFLVPNPLPGVHVYAVQAINFVGESPLSPTVTGPGIPTAPGQPTLTVVVS